MKRKFYSLLLSISFLGMLHAQDTIYYYGANHKPLPTSEKARFYKEVDYKNRKVTKIVTHVLIDENWEMTNTEKIRLISNNTYLVKIKTKKGSAKTITRKIKEVGNTNYEFHEFIDDNLVRSGFTSSLIPLCLEDTVKTYFKSGQIKSIAFYENNQLKGNKNWLKGGERYFDNVFYSVNNIPEYKLGASNFNNYIVANLFNEKIDFSQYGETIVIGWVITKSGKIEGVHIIDGHYPALGELLVNIIESSPGDWQPANLYGENVNYFMQFPINFKNPKEDGFNSLELIGNHLYWD